MASKALRNQMTRNVVVNRVELVETLKNNREQHLKVYNEAMAGYIEKANVEVEKVFKDIHQRLDKAKTEVLEKISTFSEETAKDFGDFLTILQGVGIPMEVPQSYVEAYDAAIDMFEMDVRETQELSGAEFQCFCRDVWDWSYDFSNSTSNYTKEGR